MTPAARLVKSASKYSRGPSALDLDLIVTPQKHGRRMSNLMVYRSYTLVYLRYTNARRLTLTTRKTGGARRHYMISRRDREDGRLANTFYPRGRIQQSLYFALDPPRLYFRAATLLLRAAMGLYRTGLLPRGGLALAWDGSRQLAQLGHASWRRRRALRRAAQRQPWRR